MSHNRSRSDANFAGLYDRSNQAKVASFTPPPNAGSSSHSHFRSPSDPALNQAKEPEPERLLVDIGSSNEPTPHWNPFSPYYESNELDFMANQNCVTDDDFASLRESHKKIPQTAGTNSSYQSSVEHHQPSVDFYQSNVGHHQPNAGNPTTSEFLQGAATDIFGSTTFGSQVAELQQNLVSSLENLKLVDAPAGLRGNNIIEQQQQVTEIVQDGNNPFLQGYRSSEIEQHLILEMRLVRMDEKSSMHQNILASVRPSLLLWRILSARHHSSSINLSKSQHPQKMRLARHLLMLLSLHNQKGAIISFAMFILLSSNLIPLPFPVL